MAVIFISFVVKFCFNWSKSTISCWLQTLVGSVQFIYKWRTNNITLMQDYMHWKLNVLIFQITKIISSAILLKNEFETLLLPTCTPYWLLTLPTWRTIISIVLESQDIPLVFYISKDPYMNITTFISSSLWNLFLQIFFLPLGKIYHHFVGCTVAFSHQIISITVMALPCITIIKRFTLLYTIQIVRFHIRSTCQGMSRRPSNVI